MRSLLVPGLVSGLWLRGLGCGAGSAVPQRSPEHLLCCGGGSGCRASSRGARVKAAAAPPKRAPAASNGSRVLTEALTYARLNKSRPAKAQEQPPQTHGSPQTHRVTCGGDVSFAVGDSKFGHPRSSGSRELLETANTRHTLLVGSLQVDEIPCRWLSQQRGRVQPERHPGSGGDWGSQPL